MAGLAAVSHGAIFARLADAHPTVVAAWRVGIAAVILLPAALVLSRPAIARITRGEAAAVLAAGVFLALHFVTWIASLERTSIADSVVLASLSPVWIAAAAWIAGEGPPRRAVLLSIVLALAGSAILAAGGLGEGSSTLLGDGLALVGGLCMAGYLLAGRRARRRLPLLPYIALCYATAAAALWAAVIALSLPAAGFSATTWQALFAMALVSQIIGHGSYNWALRAFDARFIAVCLLGEPVLASLFGWLWLGERPAVATVVGGALVLAGIWTGARALRD
jgi:drug/metabolite transporter (DMT)-like permease